MCACMYLVKGCDHDGRAPSFVLCVHKCAHHVLVAVGETLLHRCTRMLLLVPPHPAIAKQYMALYVLKHGIAD